MTEYINYRCFHITRSQKTAKTVAIYMETVCEKGLKMNSYSTRGEQKSHIRGILYLRIVDYSLNSNYSNKAKLAIMKDCVFQIIELPR